MIKMKFRFEANRFVTSLLEGRRMIDLGCGFGQLVKYAKNLNIDAIGLDCNHHPDVVGDLNNNLPFKDKTFNTVTCVDTIEHIKSPEHLFKEVYRILKPKGIFIITAPNSRWYRNVNHTSKFSYSSFRELITKTGFNMEKENHFIGIPLIHKYIGFGLIKRLCFHFVFKLRKEIL